MLHTLAERVLRRLPPPSFLTMPAVGVELSPRSLRWVELCPKGRSYVVGTWGETAVPQGALDVSGQVKDKAKLIEALALARKEAGLDRVIVSLPEEQTYTVTMKLPHVAKKELRESILFSIDQYVPLSPTETVFDYVVAHAPHKGDDRYEVIVSAVSKPFALEYSSLFVEAGMTPLAFEIETQAIARACVPLHAPLVAMVVDIGGQKTSMAIVRNGEVWFSSTVPIGGEMITRALSETLHCDEEDKVKYGLVEGRGENGVERVKALKMAYAPLVDDLRKHVDYWNANGRLRIDDMGKQRTGEEGKIVEIVVSGGEANVLGLAEHIGHELALPSQVANPWRNVLSFEETIPPIAKNDALRFATVIGLALRPIVPRITP